MTIYVFKVVQDIPQFRQTPLLFCDLSYLVPENNSPQGRVKKINDSGYHALWKWRTLTLRQIRQENFLVHHVRLLSCLYKKKKTSRYQSEPGTWFILHVFMKKPMDPGTLNLKTKYCALRYASFCAEKGVILFLRRVVL